MRGLVHHIDLTVRDPAASAPLYGAVLEFLGYRHDNGYEWVLDSAQSDESLNLVQAKGPNASRAHDRYAPGLHHLAWRAESREDVDRLYRLLLEVGAEILDAPADYPQYNKGRGYYAVFFADADGLKLEFVYTPVG